MTLFWLYFMSFTNVPFTFVNTMLFKCSFPICNFPPPLSESLRCIRTLSSFSLPVHRNLNTAFCRTNVFNATFFFCGTLISSISYKSYFIIWWSIYFVSISFPVENPLTTWGKTSLIISQKNLSLAAKTVLIIFVILPSLAEKASHCTFKPFSLPIILHHMRLHTKQLPIGLICLYIRYSLWRSSPFHASSLSSRWRICY